jgi:hypothetical protein
MSYPKMGVTLTDTPSTNEAGFALGERAVVQSANGEKEFIYAKAEGAVTAGFWVAIDENFDATALTHALGIASPILAVAPATFADEDYGWFQVRGYCSAAYGVASAAADVQLYTSGTTGAVGSTDITSSAPIVGARLVTAVGGGGAANTVAMLDYPKCITVFDSTT